MSRQIPPLYFTHDEVPGGVDIPMQELGQKGHSLRRIATAGCRVPRGFTILAAVGREITSQAGHWPDGAWEAVVAAIHRLQRETGRHFDGDTERPLLLAVRSGAAESMPGLLRTHLNVGRHQPGNDDPWEQLRGAIVSVAKSWDEPAARDYRRKRRIDDDAGTAVTVQEHIDCRFAGVLFTRSPAGEEDGIMLVEAVCGSGEALVAGRATPRRWTVGREDLAIRQAADRSREAVDTEAVAPFVARLPDLARTALRLEQEFGHPLDVEWGLNDEGFVYFQARPIVAPATLSVTPALQKRERDQLRSLAERGGRLWVLHNLNETLPHPTPLTWSLWQQFMTGAGGLGTLYRRLGYRPGRDVSSESFLTLIGGRIYSDPDKAVAMFGDSYPFRFSVDELRRDTSALDRAPTYFDPDRADPWLLWKLPWIGWQMLRTHQRLRRLFASAVERYEREIVPRFLDAVAAEEKVNLDGLSTGQLIQRFEARRKLVMDDFGPESLLPGTLGGIALIQFRRHAIRLFGPREGIGLCDDVLPAGDIELNLRQRTLLQDAATNSAGWSAFLREFGHRAVGEMELATPRWAETPELVTEWAAPPSATKPAEKTATPLLNRELARERLRDACMSAGVRSLRHPLERWFERCWTLLPYRDRGKHLFLRGYVLLRHVAEQLARRSGLGGDFYFLSTEEWDELDSDKDLRPLTRERRELAKAARQLRLPLIVEAEHLDDPFRETPPALTGRHVVGDPISGGRSGGMVWDPSLQPNRPPNCATVLVCPALEPSLAPLLSNVNAVIVEQGGMLSHGAILARQVGIPVVRITDATSRFASGQYLVVDGDSGVIEAMNGAPQ